MMDDDAMDTSSVKRRSVKELTKKSKKLDGKKKQAKKDTTVSPKKVYSKAEKKERKLALKTKKDLKSITKGLGSLNANEKKKGKGKSRKLPDSMQIDAKMMDNMERLNDAWGKAIQDVAEMPNNSPFQKEVLEKCKGQTVPRTRKADFIDWVEQHLHYPRADHYGQLRSLFRKIKRHYDTSKPMTKTQKRRLEKKRSKVRKQLQMQAAKAEQPLDEQTIQKRRVKHMKKKDKLKKKKLENLLKMKSGRKVKNSALLSEEQKDSVMKEIKKKKKEKKKIKLLRI